MYTDALLQLSSAQAVTATAVSTNTIDLGVARDVGPGEENSLCVTVDTTPTAAGAATVIFELIISAAANLGTPTVLASTPAIPITDLVAGRPPIFIGIPPTALTAQPLGQRYMGMRYTVGTGPLTAGAFTASIIHDQQNVGKYYPSGYTVV